MFGAHAAHLRAHLLRYSLTHLRDARAALLRASPGSGPPGSPNPWPRVSAAPHLSSRESSFPDLGFERQFKSELLVRVESTGLVPAVDIEGGMTRPRASKPAQTLGDEPVGQAPAPVLGQGSDRAHEPDRLGSRVFPVGFHVAERHGGRLAGGGRDRHENELWWFSHHQLFLGSGRKAPMVRE